MSAPLLFPVVSSARWPLPRGLRTAAPLALVAAVMAACGGGGDGAPATPFSLSAAPALPSGLVPTAGTLYSCGNVSLGAVSSDDIEVPAGQTCVLQGTRVDGNIRLNAGSTLDARDVTVIGNVQGEGATSVVLAGQTRVDGSVQLKQGGRATLVGISINGDLQYESNRGPLAAQSNRVGGNIQLSSNGGGISLLDNSARGNLQCQGNNPAPQGSGNTAASIEDQCAAMAPLGSGNGSGGGGGTGTPGDATGLPAASFASGSNVSCNNVSLGAQTYANVSVPAGARCELIGTRLTGNLELGAGASVDARDVSANGNLQGQGTASVRVSGGRFDGSLQIERGQSVTASGTAFNGSVQLEANSGAISLQNLRVSGDIQLFANRGGTSLSGNRAGGNLQCQNNAPAPTGAGNITSSKEDQCAAL